MSNNSNYKSKIQFKQKNCDKPHLYKITNLINNKYYYGIHDGSDTQNYEGSGILLHQAYEKYGKENFIKEILMWFDTEEEAYEYEAVVVNEKMINKNNPMCYNICVGGAGGDIWSCQTPERQAEISQKLSDAWNNKPEEEKEVISQKKSENWNNKTEEEKEKTNKKRSDSHKKRWEDMTPEGREEWGQKMSDAKKGEKNGAHTQYIHPYNPNFKGNCKKISHDIRKNYPNETPWNKIHWKQKQSYLVVSQDDAGLIAN